MAIKVLLLKAPSDDDTKDSYQEHLQSLGFEVSLVPVIEFSWVNSDSLLAKLEEAESYSGIIFTSKRAVKAVELATASSAGSLRRWQEKVVYVVGESTASSVTALLGLHSQGGQTGSAEALAQFIIDNENHKKKFLFPKGNLARSSLESVLTSRGHEVDDVTVYKTIPNRDLRSGLQTEKELPDYIVFFSPSGAAASLPVLQEKHPETFHQSKIIAIGPTTRGEIEKMGFSVYRVVSKPSAESLGDLLLLSVSEDNNL